MAVQLLTIADVAGLLKISVQTTQQYIRKGIIPSFKLGSEIRVHPAKLDEFLAQQAGLPREDRPRVGRPRTDFKRTLAKQYPDIFDDGEHIH